MKQQPRRQRELLRDAALMTVCYVTGGGGLQAGRNERGREGAWKQCHVLGPRHASPLRVSLKPRLHVLPSSRHQCAARQRPPTVAFAAATPSWRRSAATYGVEKHRAAGLPCASSTTVLLTPRRTRVRECGRACGGVLADVVTRAVTPEVAGVGMSEVKER